MKKLLLLMLIIILAVNTFSQDSNVSAMKKAYYLQKAKNQKTTAWVMLIGGVAFIGTGYILWNNAANNDPVGTIFLVDQNANTGYALTLIGGLSCLGSIPFFIASGNNNRRAAELSFGTQQIYLPVNGGMALKYGPAISIKIGLVKSGK